MSKQQKLSLLAILLLTMALSGLSRFAQSRSVQLAGHEGWITTDPDSLYHMRRVDRALTEGLPVAGSDEYLNFPEGSAIPWPPYYTYLAAGLLAPFAPEDSQDRRAFVEEGVASLAMWFGILATLIACIAGNAIAGRAGALVAGSYQALCQVAIAYGMLGHGDHHSFVSFLSGTLLLVMTWALCGDRLQRVRSSLGLGALAGALVGLLLGSWVGGMMYLVQLELVLGWLILRQHSEDRAGLAHFGLALHGAAALVLAPAVLSSPWTEIQPWMVVNLSWFHLSFLLLGGAVFVPLLFIARGSEHLRLYPWGVAMGLAVLAALLLKTDFAVAQAVQEGFDWASKTNSFMAGIKESHSLFAADADPGASAQLGFGIWALPLAWLAAAWACFRKGDLRLLPWVVSVPLLFLQAAQQARFAESLVLPMSVLLGWGAGRLFSAEGEGRWAGIASKLRKLPAVAVASVAVAAVALAHTSSTSLTLERLAKGKPDPIEQEGPTRIAARRMLNWLRGNSPQAPDYGVLATWGHGHAIEWAAERPSIATNFGSYVGEDSFRYPARFFMGEDPDAAKAMLEARRIRYVLVTSQLPDHLNSMIEMAAPDQRERWIDGGADGRVKPTWFSTMGARLMFDGGVFMQDGIPSLGFLRLVNISAIPDPARRLRAPTDVSPAAWLWEHVEGGQVEAYGPPGTELRVRLSINFPRAKKLITWQAGAIADAKGRAVVRVPYSTQNLSNQYRVQRSDWRFGSFTGTLELSETGVRDGARTLVHGSP